MKYAYVFGDHSGKRMLYRLSKDGVNLSVHVHRSSALGSEVLAGNGDFVAVGEDAREQDWARVLGPIAFPEPRDFKQEAFDAAEQVAERERVAAVEQARLDEIARLKAEADEAGVAAKLVESYQAKRAAAAAAAAELVSADDDVVDEPGYSI